MRELINKDNFNNLKVGDTVELSSSSMVCSRGTYVGYVKEIFPHHILFEIKNNQKNISTNSLFGPSSYYTISFTKADVISNAVEIFILRSKKEVAA